jgi:flavorubredoxin
MRTTLREGIHWVGYVDWTVRDFHGYSTDRGSTYNAYLVQDEKTALIDTVKAPYAAKLLEHIGRHTDPAAIDYIVCNHAEPDHAGGLPAVMKACPKADLVCDARCREALSKHMDTSAWRFRIVTEGDTLALGRRSLRFVETPMVHWPESMFSYMPEEKLLFSMDAFGQHYASANRFDDEEPLDVLMQEAKTYYANIVMLYAQPIARVLDRARELPIEMIAPSHGVVWRTHIPRITAAYRNWVSHHCEPRVLIVYDTMWRSTELMAGALLEGVEASGAAVRLHHVRSTNITVLATEVLEAACVAVGSPTLNQTLMPAVASVLTYWKGLKPVGKAGLAFGSYGWSKGGARDVETYLKDMKFDIVREPVQAQFVPTAAALDECREAGRLLGEKALAKAAACRAG